MALPRVVAVKMSRRYESKLVEYLLNNLCLFIYRYFTITHKKCVFSHKLSLACNFSSIVHTLDLQKVKSLIISSVAKRVRT